MRGNVREQPLASYKSYQRFLLGSIFSKRTPPFGCMEFCSCGAVRQWFCW